MIIGSLLGDARLECRSVGVRSPITARFRVHHGFKQKEYVFWKYEILKNLILKEPREISWNNQKRDLHEISWYFHSKSTKELGILHSIFYKNKVKILPDEVFKLMNPQILAVWFMDDGSNNQNGLTINTHGFSLKGQEQIIKFFKDKFNIDSKIIKDRNKWKISMNNVNKISLFSIISPFIIPSMTYKIINPRNDLLI
ncbi:MAG: LAGLIDADG endonuclease [bacterium]|nr:LAGLIDADG endonuclease [bacterium]